MSSFILYGNEEYDFISKCGNNLFDDLFCILGEIGFCISILIIILNILALVKMIKYYGTLNFETTLLILGIIQIVFLVITIMYSLIILFVMFYTVQIFAISLTIRQFKDLLKRSDENLPLIITNIINLLLTVFFIFFKYDIIKIDIKFISYYQLLFPLFYFICTLILTNYCLSIIRILVKIKTRKSFCLVVTKKSGINNKNPSNIVTSDQRDWIFFAMRKKQIKPLFIINLICSLIQIIFILLYIFVFTENTDNTNNEKQIIPNTTYEKIIYYSYLIICFMIVSVNYLCFYWLIRKQYINDDERRLKKRQKQLKKVLDDNDIKRETINNMVENSKDVSDFIDEKNNQKKFKKSLYANSFNDLEEDEDYDFFVKPKDEKNIQLINNSNSIANESISANAINRINELSNNSTEVLDSFPENNISNSMSKNK